MRRAIALVLVMSLVVIARHAGGDGAGRFATMALGFVLIVAALAGEAGERVHLPRLTGYLLVGLAFGPSALDLITPSMTEQLRLVNGLAVALIAFGAGMELDLPTLGRVWPSLVRHAGALIGIVFAGLFLVATAASPWLPFSAAESWPVRIAIALLLAGVMSTFSPTVVMAVLAETRAKGPLASRVLQIVVAGDLAVIVLFTLANTGARMLSGHGDGHLGATLGHVAWELFASPLVGALTGVGIAIYRRLVDQRSHLVVAACCVVLAEVGVRIGLSPLLACLAAGLVVRNTAPEAAHEMERLLARVRLPVLVVFFAAAGASLHLAQIAEVGLVVLGVVLVRAALIVGGNRVGARLAGLEEAVARHVPNGLVSQAGVTLGLAVLVGRDFGAWGKALETLFVAVISVHELIGPVSFRWALQKLGEVPAEPRPETEATPLPHS